MALTSVRSDRYAPCFDTTFTLPVGGSTVLHVSGASAPSGIDHLPASLFLNVTTGGTFIFTDVRGTTNTLTLAVGTYTPPFTAATIEVGTAIGTATVAWNPSP